MQVKLPDDLKVTLRIKAANAGLSVPKWLEQLIRKELNKASK